MHERLPSGLRAMITLLRCAQSVSVDKRPQKLIERDAEHRSLETCNTRVPIGRTTVSRQSRNYAFCRSKKSAGFPNIHSPRVCQFFVPT